MNKATTTTIFVIAGLLSQSQTSVLSPAFAAAPAKSASSKPAASKSGAAESAEESGKKKLANQKYSEALNDFKNALSGHQKGGTPEQLAYDSAYIALLEARTNAFDQAAETAESSRAKLASASSKQGKEGLAIALNALGLVSANKGEVENAREQLEAALQIEQQLWIGGDARLADALVDIAKVEQSQGLNANAEESFQKALSMREKLSGAQSPLLVYVLEGYADLLTSMDRKADAAKLRQRAIAVKSTSAGGGAGAGGRNTENSLWTKYMSQGQEHLMAQQKSEAKASYKLALDEAEKLGPNDPKVAAALTQLARICQMDSDWKGAEEYLKRARTVYEQTDPEGPQMADVLRDLSSCYTVTGREREAFETSKQALALMEKTSSPDDPKLENFMMQVGVSAMRLKANQEAESMFNKLMQMAEKSGDRQKRGRYMSMLGSIYMQEGRQQQGLSLIKQGAELMK